MSATLLLPDDVKSALDLLKSTESSLSSSSSFKRQNAARLLASYFQSATHPELNNLNIFIFDNTLDEKWSWEEDSSFPLNGWADESKQLERARCFPYWPKEQTLLQDIHDFCEQWDHVSYEYQIDSLEVINWNDEILKSINKNYLFERTQQELTSVHIGLYSISRWNPKREFDSVTHLRITLRTIARLYIQSALTVEQKALIDSNLKKMYSELAAFPPRKEQRFDFARAAYRSCSIL